MSEARLKGYADLMSSVISRAIGQPWGIVRPRRVVTVDDSCLQEGADSLIFTVDVVRSNDQIPWDAIDRAEAVALGEVGDGAWISSRAVEMSGDDADKEPHYEARAREYAASFGALMDSVICRPWGRVVPEESICNEVNCEWCGYPWKFGVCPDGYPVCIACGVEPCYEGPRVLTYYTLNVVVDKDVPESTIAAAMSFAWRRIETHECHDVRCVVRTEAEL